MVNIQKINPMARAIGVMGVVVALVAGVTFALTSQATLTENTISSVTADLLVNNTEDGEGDSNTDNGFSFANVTPGGAGVTHNFLLRNNGDVSMTITVDATDPSGGIPSNLDSTKVDVKFVNTSNGNAEATYTLDALINGAPENMPGVSGPSVNDQLVASEVNNFTVTVSMDPDAIIGENASVGNFDMVFEGTQVL